MKRTLFSICLVLLVYAAFAPDSFAQRRGGGQGRGDKNQPNPGNENMIPLPPAVRKTAEAEAGRGKIVDAESTTEDGEAVYDVTIGYGRLAERSLTIAPDGTLLSRQVFLAELPPAVKRTITSFDRFGRVGDIYMNFEDGDTNYAVEINQAAGKRFLTVGPDGTHEATQMQMAEVPQTVQKTILAQAAGGNVFNIDRSETDGGKIFNVLMIQGGKRRIVSIDTDGAVTGTQVYLPEIPAPCQVNITKNAGGAKIVYIERSVEEGEITYDVTTVNNGTKREFVVGKDGQLLSTVIPVSETPEAVRAAIRDKTSGGRITRAEKLADESGYEVEVEKDGKKNTVTVSADGNFK